MGLHHSSVNGTKLLARRRSRWETLGEREDECGLDHPRRVAIYELVQEEPGTTKNQVCRRLDLSLGVAEFHISRLERSGLLHRLRSTHDDERLLFTDENRHLWTNARTRMLYGHGATRNVAMAVLENPGATTRDLASLLDVHRATVSRHLARLKDAGLVAVSRDGRSVLYDPSLPLMRWQDRVGENFPCPWDPEGGAEAPGVMREAPHD